MAEWQKAVETQRATPEMCINEGSGDFSLIQPVIITA